MKHIISILLIACICIGVYAQTPYDSFAPETSRPLLDIGVVASDFIDSSDTILCVAVIDVQRQTLSLVSLPEGEILATSPITDDIRKWLSVDPLADKYPHISPYAYCGWNPIMNIDQHGDSVAIFIAPDRVGNAGHMAMAVQNEEGKWGLYSKNGAGKSGGSSDSSNSLDPNDVGKRIESPGQFLTDEKDNTIKHDGEGGKYYKDFFIIPTDKNQDAKIADKMREQVQDVPYNLFFNNCTQAVQRALTEAGVPIGNPTMIPNKAMQNIKKANKL